MTELDGVLPGEALALIAEYGASVAYTAKGVPTYNPATLTATVPATGPVALPAIPEAMKGKEFQGELVKAGDLKLYMAGLSFPTTEPTPGDVVAFNGAYTVLAAKPYYSGELVALWELMLRK